MSLPSTRTAAGVGCTSRGPTVPSMSTSVLSANTLTSWQSRLGSQCIGAGTPETLRVVAASDCSLIEAVTLCDTLTAGGAMTVNVPAFSSNGPYRVGFVKTILSLPTGASATNVTASAVTTTLQPGDSVSYIWQSSRWIKLSGSGSGAASVAVPVGQSVFVDATTGSDITGLPYRFDRMFATVQAAINAAADGDTVFIYPGTYAADPVITLNDGINLAGMDAIAVYNDTLFGTTGAKISLEATVTINVPGLTVRNTISNLQIRAPIGTNAFQYTNAAVLGSPLRFNTVRFVTQDATSSAFSKTAGTLQCFFQNCSFLCEVNDVLAVVFNSTSGGNMQFFNSFLRGGMNVTTGSLFCSNSRFQLNSTPVTSLQTNGTWDNCVISGNTAQAPSLDPRGGSSHTFTDCTFSVGNLTVPASATGTGSLTFRTCLLGTGLLVQTPTIGNITVINGQVASTFSIGVGVGGYNGTMSAIGVAFSGTMPLEHLAAGGGSFNFTSCQFANTSITINQPVASAAQAVSFVNNRFGVTGTSATIGCIVYTVGAADTANASRHVFSGNAVVASGTTVATRPLITTAGVNALTVTSINNATPQDILGATGARPVFVSPISSAPLMRTEQGSETIVGAAAAAYVLTIAQATSGSPLDTSAATGAFTITLPTAAQVSTCMGANAGSSFQFWVINNSAFAGTLQATGGDAANMIVVAGSNTIAANSMRSVTVILRTGTTAWASFT